MMIGSDIWKNELIDAIIESYINKENTDILAKVGYSYKCYAPKYLYKYYSNKPCNLESIKNCKLWFSAPCNYNDVFDCDLSVDEKAIMDFITNSFPDKRGVRVGSQMWHEISKKSNHSVRELKKVLANIRNTIGIACFSESDDSLLMWSHYANNHTGICVEYDMIEVIDELKFTPVPVLYSGNRVVINKIGPKSINDDALDSFIHCVVTKSIEWSYEKEWRIIRDQEACGDRWDTTNKGALLDMVRPNSLILGCMVNENLERQAKAYCNDNRINLYKMKKSEDTYSLIKETILEFNVD